MTTLGFPIMNRELATDFEVYRDLKETLKSSVDLPTKLFELTEKIPRFLLILMLSTDKNFCQNSIFWSIGCL